MWKFVWLAVAYGLVWGQDHFVPNNYEEITTQRLDGFGAEEKCGEGKSKGLFKCVVYSRCDGITHMIIPESSTNGYGMIDIRFGANSCPDMLDVCCKIPPGGDPHVTTSTTEGPSPTPNPNPTPSPPPTGESFCGIRNINGIDFKITGNTHNEAEYGEFPWMMAILKANYDPAVDATLAVCGGSLIAPSVVLTGAHCVHKYQPGDIKVRAGEWDTQTQKERLPYQERNVAQIITHEQFQDGILHNDVALLVLDKPFKKAAHIGTICLPEQNELINSQNCLATGWGKNLFGLQGQYQVILKKIELPIVPNRQCEASLRETRLGPLFELDESFICAGGIAGRDTCTGDGGSPLVCPDPKNPSRYVQAGIVAWGIGCGTTTPGVYANVAKFRSWVDKQMGRLNFDTITYTS